jgi:hypothetical protein
LHDTDRRAVGLVVNLAFQGLRQFEAIDKPVSPT